MLDLEKLINRMTHSAEVVESLVRGVDDTQARWKPSPEDWSILEVINHLYEEEQADFRVRVDILIYHPERDVPDIDPMGWVTSRRYNERDLGESLANFLAERRKSLDWLKGLESPNWEAGLDHPWTQGRGRAGDVMAAWAAHDLLHIRQLNELHYLYHAEVSKPYSPEYAGEWR